MIEIKVHWAKDNLSGYEIKGHALYAEEGEDIVCAAISVLAQTGVFSLDRFTSMELEKDVDKGMLCCEIPEDISQEEKNKAELIIKTVLVGMYETARAYPERIKIIDERGLFSC